MATDDLHIQLDGTPRPGRRLPRRKGRAELIGGLSRSPLRGPVLAILGGLVAVAALLTISA